MINIRQSPLYTDFMRRIGWIVEEIDGVFIFIKKFPFLGAVAKIQRPNHLPSYNKLKQLMQKYHLRSISVEPNFNYQLSINNYQLSHDPYIHTKTIHIDLTASETTVFNRFSSAKRRAVRRAQNLGVTVSIGDNLEDFIKLKNRAAGLFLGFMTTQGFTKPLWHTFAPQHARVLLASLPQEKNIAGILLLFYEGIAYYWMAAANRRGKKYFAPSLCVWEALKFAKKENCTDFEGVFDERFSKQSPQWKGFSKFKAGFGGKNIYYPEPFLIK